VAWCLPCHSLPQLAHSSKDTLLHCCPDAFLTGHTSPCLFQPVCCGPELLLKTIDPDMDVPSWPLYSDALIFDELAEFIDNAHFCHAILFIASMPSVVVSLFCQPVYDHCHQVDLWCQTIFLPWHPTFIFACGHLGHFLVVGGETSLTTEQKALPLILCNCKHHFLKATRMNEVLTTGLLHASKGSSFLRHLALSLQLGSICGMQLV